MFIKILFTVCFFYACWDVNSQNEDIEIIGEYNPFGYRRTQKTIEDSISFKEPPKLYFFKNRIVKISPDFSFGYFKDTIFNYEFEKNLLILKGNKSILKIKYEQKLNFKMIKLFFGHKYIENIEFLLIEK